MRFSLVMQHFFSSGSAFIASSQRCLLDALSVVLRRRKRRYAGGQKVHLGRSSEGESISRSRRMNNTCRWTFCMRRKQKKQRRHYVIARPYGAAGRQKLSRTSACHLGADCGKLCASLRRRWFFLASQLEVRCEALANVVLPFFYAGVYDRTFDLLRATGWLTRFDCRTPFWRR